MSRRPSSIVTASVVPLADSVDKIVTIYFGSLCAEAFTYKGTVFNPAPLVVSPLLLRGFTCPEQCGGCCPRFSLDYLPSERCPPGLSARTIRIDDREVRIYSDLQDDHRRHFCRHLKPDDGRCRIYRMRPFSCDFELIRFVRRDTGTVLTQKLFGRGWAMVRVDGGRGARCEMLPPSPDATAEVMRKLNRLEQWAEHFGVRVHTHTILAWIQDGPHNEPLRIPSPV